MDHNKEKSLVGKVAWVTGSSRGIGKSIAEYFASQGAIVIIHGSSPDSPQVFKEGDSLAANAAAIAEKHRVRCLAVTGDLTDYGVVERLVTEIRSDLGAIDILVNCAGGDIGARGIRVGMAGKPENNDAVFISVEDTRTILDRNFMTCVLCCKAVVPDMMKRKSGRIVNIGSIAALKGIPSSVMYASAKAALHEYSRCLAVQMRPYDITVNVVAPGDTVTERFQASRTTEDALKVRSGTLERYGWPEEIAAAAAFLASDAAGFISGQVVRVDGGSQCWPA